MIRRWRNNLMLLWIVRKYVRQNQRRADAEGRKERYQATITWPSGHETHIGGDPL